MKGENDILLSAGSLANSYLVLLALFIFPNRSGPAGIFKAFKLISDE